MDLPNKLLFLGAGSKEDSSFDKSLEEVFGDNPIDAAFRDFGIHIVTPTVIESCHGCEDLMKAYSAQIQQLNKWGIKVVSLLEGGLLFGLPSIQATQITSPIISCPLDMIAYTAFMVPKGHAAIAGVGIERKIEGSKEYQNIQRTRAIINAQKMLNFSGTSVELYSAGSRDVNEKILKSLKELNIRIGVPSSRLRLTYSPTPLEVDERDIQIWADSSQDLMSGAYLDKAEAILAKSPNTIQVRGPENLVIYAAKILSLTNPALRAEIKKMADDKRATYDKEPRDIIWEMITTTYKRR